MQDPKKLINSQDVSAAENKEAMPVKVPWLKLIWSHASDLLAYKNWTEFFVAYEYVVSIFPHTTNSTFFLHIWQKSLSSYWNAQVFPHSPRRDPSPPPLRLSIRFDINIIILLFSLIINPRRDPSPPPLRLSITIMMIILTIMKMKIMAQFSCKCI